MRIASYSETIYGSLDLARPEFISICPSEADVEAAEPAVAISVEITTPERFLTMERAWRDLVARAAVPNVFMEPSVVASAALAGVGAVHVLLAWGAPSQSAGERLLGAWALVACRPSSGLPVAVLKAPVHGHAALGTPVIDACLAVPVLACMLQAVHDEPSLPNLFEVNALHASGPIADAFERVGALRSMRLVFVDPRMRPQLRTGRDACAPPLSKSRAKALRQRRRRLSEHGAVSCTVASRREDVALALEDFLTLEASGWKGKGGARGRAILRTPALAVFFREAVMRLADRGLASITALRVAGRPVAVQVAVTSGRTVYTWKTAYDETLRPCAPGLLLLQELTASFLSRPELDCADSCNHRGDGYMAEFWGGRLAVVDAVFDVRPATSPALLLLGAAEVLNWRAKRSARRLVRVVAGLTARARWPAAFRRVVGLDASGSRRSET